ncbi:J domain-containing protein, partial [Pseudomonas viridiflava]|uniref:J domain-containing protein n=1 Tax=Pseudomonas viridiflava TaxID=33069 RepID=UPI0013C36000
MQRTPTHYELLNVARDASPDQIKKAYRKIAQKLHPDRNSDPYASDMMSVVNASHDVLADAGRRAVYDAQLVADEQRAREDAARRRQVQAMRGRAVHVYASASGSASAAPQQSTYTGPERRANVSPQPSRSQRHGSVWRWA